MMFSLLVYFSCAAYYLYALHDMGNRNMANSSTKGLVAPTWFNFDLRSNLTLILV